MNPLLQNQQQNQQQNQPVQILNAIKGMNPQTAQSQMQQLVSSGKITAQQFESLKSQAQQFGAKFGLI
jgi:DNA-binding FadR family transcriptional regulator